MDDTTVGYHQARLLHRAIGQTNLTLRQVWLHYLSRGGRVGTLEWEAYLNRCLYVPAAERDLLAETVNALLDHRVHPPVPTALQLRITHGRDGCPDGDH